MNDKALLEGAIASRSVDANRGVAWWTEAWALFMKNAAMWVLFGIALVVIFGVLSMIPILGGLAAALIAPILAGSCLLAARKADTGGALEFGDLFAAFQTKAAPLAIIGALLMGATIVFVVIVGVLGVGAAMGMTAGGMHRSAGGAFAAMGAGLMMMLLSLAFGVIVTLATWFAPALIVFRDASPVDAVKSSVAACLKNIVPFLLWGLILIVASVVATIPFGLGWLVLLPLAMLTAYLSYKDIFGAP